MLMLSLWINEVEATTCKQYTIDLGEDFHKLVLRHVKRNSYSSRACPLNKVIINFKNVVFIVEIVHLAIGCGLSKNTNNRDVVESAFSVLMEGISRILYLRHGLVCFPIVNDVIVGKFMFKTMWWSVEF